MVSEKADEDAAGVTSPLILATLAARGARCTQTNDKWSILRGRPSHLPPMDPIDLITRARALQEAYWSPNPAEKRRLLAGDVDRLDGSQSFRLLHLACLDLAATGPVALALADEDADDSDAPAGAERDLIVRLLQRLGAADSPYASRPVSVWQGKPGESATRQPDLAGKLRNASMTHLGALEIVRLDAADQPASIAFVPLGDLSGAVFATPSIFRFAKLFYDNGQDAEIVLLPLLYGISWRSPHPFDQDGTMTRFIGHLDVPGQAGLSIGVGQQDFVLEPQEGGQTLFGLGSVGELIVALSVEDPAFEAKCRARGLDPAEVRRALG